MSDVPAPFERTLRALELERSRGLWGWVALVALAAWVAWAVLGDVGVYVRSAAGRIEVTEPVHVLRAEADARLVAVHARLGAEVAEGDVLYELDSADQAIAIAEADARRAAIEAERTVLAAAIAAASRALAGGEDVLAAALAEAKAKQAQARSEGVAAEREVDRLVGLADAVSARELDRAKVAVAVRRAEIGAAAALANRLSAEEAQASSDRAATVERMRQDLARLDGELAMVEAARRTAEVAQQRRLVRAPRAGILGELPALRPGDLVSAGDALGALVPDGELHVVAYFSAARALGWVRPGAAATVSLDAYPWTWYGLVPATVRDVALEPRDGLLRVELALDARDEAGALALRHGLSGEVEIEVERSRPLALLMRAAGARSGAGTSAE